MACTAGGYGRSMLSMTLHVPEALADPVADVLLADPVSFNVTRLQGACSEPRGDVIGCTVPREGVPRLLAALADVGYDEHTGTITLDERLTVLGDAADEAARAAKGAPDDALVWSALRASTSVATELSFVYFAFMVLATFLAAIGLVTSSSVLIVGSMILGPEFGALAHLCVSALGRDIGGMGRAGLQLSAGFSTAIAMTACFTWLMGEAGVLRIHEIAPTFEKSIVSPSVAGLLIALIAGIAGVLTLTSAKGEALIGVLVSVTTIPAAADMALGIANSDSQRAGNGAATLLLNLAGMVVAGGLTLGIYRGVTRTRASVRTTT